MGVNITSLGFRQPDGSERVRDGNDVISYNAGVSDTHIGDALRRIGITETQINENPLDPAVTEGLLADIFANPVSPAIKALTTTNTRPVGKGELVVNVMDYGARRDGSDSLPAFQAAFAVSTKVFVPEGTFHVSAAVEVPTNGELFGAGMGRTTIRLTDSASVGTWVVTNDNRTGGNVQLYVHDLTLDWNVSRTWDPNYSGEGGSRSSGLTFGNVTYGYVDRVESVNAGLHGFDVCQGALDYPYDGDGSVATGRSRHVYLNSCIARDWGDDGFTTHHSDYVFISNCYAELPRKRGNNNGFEVDDGTRHAFLTNNTSYKCATGVEVKAHENASAATDVHIQGHLSIEDNQGYRFRHIGYQSGGTESSTAFDVTASNLVAWHPNDREGFGEPPAALHVRSYRNVSVSGLTAVADPTYDYTGDHIVSVAGLASNTALSGVNIRGFDTAAADVHVEGTATVSLSGVNLYESAAVGVVCPSPDVSITGLVQTGGATLIQADGRDYSSLVEYQQRLEELFFSTTPALSGVLLPGLYYISHAEYSQMTDAPSPGGNMLLQVARFGGVAMQHLTLNNSSGAAPEQYTRVISSGTVGTWAATTLTEV